ncbi:MAG: hypothetical protein AAB360_03760 [Patescibacteria group bacterium]
MFEPVENPSVILGASYSKLLDSASLRSKNSCDDISTPELHITRNNEAIVNFNGKFEFLCWFESKGEGRGTTFFFTLPILDKKPEDPHEGEGPVLQLK